LQHAVPQQLSDQRIRQRLQAHTAGSEPLRPCRARHHHAGTLEHGFLAGQRAVIEVPGGKHLSQQPGRRRARADRIALEVMSSVVAAHSPAG
jgi:hypothetical protein